MKQIAPLTKIQYGIYAECVGHNGEICYNLPFLYTLDKSLDVNRLCKAIETVVAAHPTLFTRIVLNDVGEPMQQIEVGSFKVEVEDIDDIEAVKPSLAKPFDIYADRLFRIRLLRDANHLYFYTEYHHIIVDAADDWRH